MASIISKLTCGITSQPPPPLVNNPITTSFEVGNQTCTVGPGLIWRVHDAFRKSDGKECSVFVFDKRIADKLYKPKRKETMLERMRMTVTHLEKMRNPKMLQVIHSIEEGPTTIAFAAEPVMASLQNILAWQETVTIQGSPPPIMPHPITLGPPPQQSMNSSSQRPPFSKEYWFHEIELRYGLTQMIEALNYLHYTTKQVHRNVCPQVIVVTKRGTWKLFGLEFAENIVGPDPTEMIAVSPWSIKIAKIAQPNLDFLGSKVAYMLLGPCFIKVQVTSNKFHTLVNFVMYWKKNINVRRIVTCY